MRNSSVFVRHGYYETRLQQCLTTTALNDTLTI